MITSKTKGKKTYLSSSYFDDIKMLRRSRSDTDYRDLYRNTTIDVARLQGAYVVQEIILWRKGCIELSDHVSKLSNHQLEGIVTVYMGQDWNDTINDKETFTIGDIASPDDQNPIILRRVAIS